MKEFTKRKIDASIPFFRNNFNVGSITIGSRITDMYEREYVKGDGLFDVGVKIDVRLKKRIVSPEQQIKDIRNISGVESYDPSTHTAMVWVKHRGRFKVILGQSPKVYNRGSIKVPFGMSHNSICLGSGGGHYSNAWYLKDYEACLKIIIAVMRSGWVDHGLW